MKKREKILLEVFICVLLFAGICVLFLKPALVKNQELAERAAVAEARQVEMQRLIENKTLDKDLKTQQDVSKTNYEFFYSVLNSYNLDEILNNMAKEKSLSIQNLSIGEYEDAGDDFPLEAENKIEEQEGTAESETTAQSEQVLDNPANLLKAQVSVSVTGSYENILAYIDGLNAQSVCLRVDSISLSPNERDATGKAGQNAVISISVYGINQPKEQTEMKTEIETEPETEVQSEN